MMNTINFTLLDDHIDIQLELLDDNQEINFSMTDYDDTAIKEEITNIQHQVDTNTNDIQTLSDMVDQIPIVTKTSQLTNDSGFITSAYHDSTKQDKLISGTNIKTINGISILGSGNITIESGAGDYPDLTNLPSINNVTLLGNKTSSDLGLQPAGNYATSQELTDEATARENADTGLQNQIDAITVSSDVIDVLGTYQDLQNYDTSHVKANDIIKVMQDSTHSNAISYYRWVIVDHVGAWVYVGSEGPYYTKGETDTLLNAKQNTINSNNKLESDLVTDTNQTNLFVTSQNKTDWNAKVDYGATLLQYMRQNSNQIYYPSVDGLPVITVTKAVFDSTTRNISIGESQDIVIDGIHTLDYYNMVKYINLDLSPYNSATQAQMLHPETQLPNGVYIVTSAGKIWFSTESYNCIPGEIIFKQGNEIAITGMYGCVYYAYDTGEEEWQGGFFTTYADVQNMIEEANPVKNYTISKSTSATGSISLVNGRWTKKTRTAGITSGSCATPNNLTEVPDTYRCRFTLRTATNFTTFTVTQKTTYKIYFVGDDCANGSINMVADKYYDVQLEADGFGDIIGHVYSYTLPS